MGIRRATRLTVAWDRQLARLGWTLPRPDAFSYDLQNEG
jgi:hypothetical protein